MGGGVRITCRLEVLPGACVLDRLKAAHRYGFDGVALPGRYLDRYLEELRACVADSPLPLDALSLGFAGSLVSPDPTVRERCRDSLLRLLDLCAELGVGKLNMPPALIQDNPVRLTDPDPYPDVTAAQDALLLEQLPLLAREAAQRDVLLLLEPVNRYEADYLIRLEHAARLCREVDHSHLGCTADFFHMQLEELRPAEAIRRAGRWVRHVHVAENTRVEPGPGTLDFRPGFRALREIGYPGALEVECRALSGPPDEVLPRSVVYLRTLWEGAEDESEGAGGGHGLKSGAD